MTFNYSSHTIESKAYHPIEIRLEKQHGNIWSIDYIT
ncbi:DUF2787 domain-containing protein [Limnobaculum parvum]|uniref:DUF2787 domain-containing protein n=1 Tax=Limnobaculum parvum TaxID=2172103 RepID=A0A2Y9U2I6_9GAMM|nr:DUF2787 domain-containing protein [Limnobaculum parvum]